MFKLAYVDKAKIENSIAQQVIPEESLIVTNSEANNAELSYYDEKGNLKSIVKKTQFRVLLKLNIGLLNMVTTKVRPYLYWRMVNGTHTLSIKMVK